MRAALLGLVVAVAATLGTPAADAATRTDVVVKLADAAAATDVSHALGGRLGLVVSEDTVVVEDAIVGARVPPGVEWLAPDRTYRSARQPTDACFETCSFAVEGQEELLAVGADTAWEVTTGSAAIVVAVLDGVVDASHPDLAGKVTTGPTYLRNRCDDASAAEASHATGVAGIVGATTDNGIGIASLGWRTRVLAVAVLDECGSGTASEVSAGIRHAVDAGARIVNLSLAGGAHPALAEAVDYAQQRGALVVAAAGNGGSSVPVFPAAYPGVVAVGSTSADGKRLSTFSNRGTWVDLVAPGESIVSTSTVPGGYFSYDGTSFAAPFVSAAAALVLASHPAFTAADVAERLAISAARFSGTNGRLDAGAAVNDLPGGFVLVAEDGGVFAFGDAEFWGSTGDLRLNQPIVAAAADGVDGYWFAAADGGVFTFGVPFFGSTGNITLNQPIVGMAATPSGDGYWLVASDGGIFAFGDAPFFGSTGNITLNQPIVGMAATPSGLGYWLVASDGGIFAFGDAGFAGSTGGIRLSAPIVGMAAESRTSYWLAAEDGGVFAFGGARFHGSGAGASGPGVVGIGAAPGADGYWLARSDGVSLTFGLAFHGGRTPPLNSPVVAIASTAT